MKLVYLHQYFSPPEGSGNNRSLELCTYLTKQGLTVKVITSTAYFPGGYFKEEKALYKLQINGFEVWVINVKYHHQMPLFKRAWAFMQFAFKAYHLLKTLEIDLLYAVSTPLTVGWVALQLKKQKGIPYFFEPGDLWPDAPLDMLGIQNRWLRKPFYFIESEIYQNANHLIALSEGIKDGIIRKGIPSEKVSVLHNGTNTQIFCPAENKFALRTKLGLPTDKVIGIYAGTFGKANAVHALVAAAADLHKKGISNAYFVLIGSGNNEKAIWDALEKLKPGNVQIIPTVSKSEIISYLQAADIGLVTFAPFRILETNSANKFYDYLACGLPVCTNYQGWQKHYLDNYQCGIAAEQGDSLSFSENIRLLIENKTILNAYSVNARKLSTAFFDREQIASRLYQLIQTDELLK